MSVVNLGAARKKRAKEAKKLQANTNAAKFGLSKSEKVNAQAANKRTRDLLDGHERDRE